MRRVSLILATLGLVAIACRQVHPRPPAPHPSLDYPTTRRVEQWDEFHGTRVADPYRWLEAVDSPEVIQWIDAQRSVYEQVLTEGPIRSKARERLKDLRSLSDYGLPIGRPGRLFYTYNSGHEDQSSLFVSTSSAEPGRLLLDPNQLSPDGTTSLVSYTPSPDGRFVAYGLSAGGSDRLTWRVLEVATGESIVGAFQLGNTGSIQWSDASDSLFHLQHEEAPGRLEVVHRRLADVTDGRILLSIPTPDEGLLHFLWPIDKGPDLFVASMDKRTGNTTVDLVEVDPRQGTAMSSPFISDRDGFFRVLGKLGQFIVVLTDLDAPNFRVIGVPRNEPRRDAWRDLVPETDNPIWPVAITGRHVVVCSLVDVLPQVQVYSELGALTATAALPGLGTLGGFSESALEDELFLAFESESLPPTVYTLDVTTGATAPVWEPQVNADEGSYVTQQVFYASADGTTVPMFISYKEGLKRNGRAPVMLSGYGAFQVPITPRFGGLSRAWMELGGVHATPNIRGGGEYGAAWHAAGSKLNKQNGIDDFIAAAEWLVAEGYTAPDRIAAIGSSAGGLLVGACVTQRPDLFRVGLIDSGTLDSLRREALNGFTQESEFGSPEDSDEFRAMHAYSPLHNVRTGIDYPAMLVSTGTTDDRVGPANSYKFVAALQAAQASDRPILLRTQQDSGHSSLSTDALADLQADRLTFMIEQMGLTEQALDAFSD